MPFAAMTGSTLVDPGWASAESESVLVAALRQLGYEPRDVRRILVTHAHWDHYTQAVKWQREYGATLLLGREERHTIEAFDRIDGVYPNQVCYCAALARPPWPMSSSDWNWSRTNATCRSGTQTFGCEAVRKSIAAVD